MDHIHPVIDPVEGWRGFDSYLTRLLCSTEGYQGLCKPCHYIKTQQENRRRREI